MDNQDELVQVNVSLPKSHLSILPELMRVVTTACSSSYSWDSMKLSVNSDIIADKGSRIILNLGKSVSLDSEVIQGKLHTCKESICKHHRTWNDLIGDVSMTTFAQRSLKEHFKEQEKLEEDELEGTGWLEKELSDEMFFPSWYDHLRLKSVSHLGDGFFQAETLQVQPPPAPLFEVNHVQAEPFYESDSEEYFPLKKNVKPYTKTAEVSDETFRLKKVCDRAKNYTQIPDLNEEKDQTAFAPSNAKLTIRELKERLDPPVPSQPEIYQENYVFLKSGPQEVTDKDYTYRQYLCYDEELPNFPLCETDESANPRKDITIKNHELQQNFMRQMPTEDFKNSKKIEDSMKDYGRDDELIVVMPPSIKKTMFHRSYSANVVSRQYNDEDSTRREYSPSKKKREEKKRPKSGPEKRVEFIRPSARDELSQGDSFLISEGRPESIRNMILSTALENIESGPAEGVKEKKKKRRTLESPEKRSDGMKMESIKETFRDDKRIKEKKHKTDDKAKEAGPTLVISYKPFEDETKSDLIKSKPKYHKEEKGYNKQEVKQKKVDRKRNGDDVIVDAKLRLHSPEKHEDKRDGRSKTKGDEKKPNKRPRSQKSDKTRTLESKPPSSKPSKAANQQEIGKDKGNADSLKTKRRGFLGKRISPGTTIKEETHPSGDDKTSTDLEDRAHNKRAMSFLELISVMTEEVKQFGKKKEQKKLRDKIS